MLQSRNHQSKISGWSYFDDTDNFNEEENSCDDDAGGEDGKKEENTFKREGQTPQQTIRDVKIKSLKPRGGIQVVDLKKGSGPECEPGNRVDMFCFMKVSSAE